MTDRFLSSAGAISSNRGPRCCKHSTMIVVEVITRYFREVLGVEFVIYLPPGCGASGVRYSTDET